jgi:PAS domain S-box-containing protein
MPETVLSAKVLGKLLVALQTLDVLPHVQSMAAFLQPALGEVPGISGAVVCLNGEFPCADPATIAKQDVQCPKAAGASSSSSFSSSVPVCLLVDRPDIHLVTIRTPRQAFGCLMVMVDDEAQFDAYKPFLVNIGHMVATILENREHLRSVAAANAKLKEVIDELESRVRDRTRDLEAAEERYRMLAENASDVVILMTPDWSFEWVSGSVADVLGWKASELVGHRIEDFVHPGDLARFRAAVADAGQGSAASVEFRYRRSDGTYHWLAGRTRVKVDEDGTPAGVVGGLVDIAERKATEAMERERLAELERFKQLTVGRELRMIELKKEIEHLKKAAAAAAGSPDGR